MAFANCTPNEPWPTATSAGVQSLDESFSERTLPVEHRDWGIYTIKKSEYPQGLVLIPTGSDPAAIPAVLPVLTTEEDELNVTLDSENLLDFHVGGVPVFL